MGFVLCPSLPHNALIIKSAPKRKQVSAQTDARLGRIVRLLMDHATVVMSGTKIADEIGTTRSEIWRLVQQLRELNVDVPGHPATGYQLRSIPDLLLPDFLKQSLEGTIFAGNINHYFRIGSTNATALEAAAAGAPEGTVLLAEEQTAGRGRGAHTWHSVRSSGIYCSVILRPALPPSDVLTLTLAAGLAVYSVVEELGVAANLDLKWPNDALLNGKKFCGILAEMSSEATRVRHIVLGIGLNVNHRNFPADLQETATSLRLVSGTEWSRVELTIALLKSLDREYRGLLEGEPGRASILRRFAERSSFVRGKHVCVQENEALAGVTEGLDEHGFLQIRTAQGLRTVLSGTVWAR